MTKRLVLRSVVAALSLALVASACFGGGSDPSEQAQGLADRGAGDVRPPELLDPELVGQPGLVVATNSRSWQELVGSPDQPGAVILFVQPGGPSDGNAIARGDLLVGVDDTTVANHEHAIAELRTVPGQERELHLIERDGTERSVTVEPRDPGDVNLLNFLGPMIDANPSDPVLRFLRAQTGGASFEDRIADVDRALAEESTFVEAMALRASLLWDSRSQREDEGEFTQQVNEALAGWQAALDIDPDNTTALSLKSTAVTALGNADQGKTDAEKVLSLDATYPRGYYALALAERALDRAEDAAGPAAAAIDLNPFNALYWRVLADTFTDIDRADDCNATVDAFAEFLNAQNLESEVESIRELCG